MRILSLLVLLIILVRASLDGPLLVLQGEGEGMGTGAFLNIIMIVSAFLFILLDGWRVPLIEFLLWVTFLVACALLSLSSPDPIYAARIWLGLFTYACAMFLPYYLIRAEGDFNVVLNAVLLSGIIPTIVGLYQVATNIGVQDFRAQATFTHPNILAFYIFVLLAAIALKYNQAGMGGVGRLGLIVFGAASFLLILFTGTRSAWIGVAILVLTYVVLIDRRQVWIVLVAPLAFYLIPQVYNRLVNVASEAEFVGSGVILNSYEWRKELWAAAFEWIRHSPFSGHGGLNSFFYYSTDFFRFGPPEEKGVYAHSVYVMLLFELGIVGFALFVAILVSIAIKSFLSLKYEWVNSVLKLALILGFAAFSYSDNMLGYLAFNWYFWFLVGSIGAQHKLYLGGGGGSLVRASA